MRHLARSSFRYFRPSVELLEDRNPPGNLFSIAWGVPNVSALSLLPPPSADTAKPADVAMGDFPTAVDRTSPARWLDEVEWETRPRETTSAPVKFSSGSHDVGWAPPTAPSLTGGYSSGSTLLPTPSRWAEPTLHDAPIGWTPFAAPGSSPPFQGGAGGVGFDFPNSFGGNDPSPQSGGLGFGGIGGGMGNGFGGGGGGEGGMDLINEEDDTVELREDEPYNIYFLLYNDFDPEGDTLVITELTQPDHGTVTLLDDQTVDWTPEANWHGTDYFDYVVTDGNGNYDTATATLNVEEVNDAPVADPKNVSVPEDTPLTISFSGSDIEESELSYYLVDGPAHGMLSDIDGDQITYYPDGNFQGLDTFTYQSFDGQDLSDPVKVRVTVQSVTDDPGVTITPSLNSTALTEGDEESSDTYTVVLNTAPTADVVVTLSPDAHLKTSATTLTFTTSNWNVAQTVTVTAVNDNVDDGDHFGLITHTVTSTDLVYDGIAVGNEKAALTDDDIAGIWFTPNENWQHLRENLATANNTYTVELTSQPTDDVTVTLTADGQVTLSKSELVFTSANWDTPQTVSVTRVDDSTVEGYHSGKITHTVSSKDAMYDTMGRELGVLIYDDEAPNAVPDEFELYEDEGTAFAVLANDVDGQGDPLSITGFTQGEHGKVSYDLFGGLLYTPDANWSGEDSFEYTIGDGSGKSNTAEVSITVIPTNDPPVVINSGNQQFAEDHWQTLKLLDVWDEEENFFSYTLEKNIVAPPGMKVGLPEGLSLDPFTGVISGAIGSTAAGKYYTKILVGDFVGGVTPTEFTWNITDTNHGPLIAYIGDQVNNVGDSVDLVIETYDIDPNETIITDVSNTFKLPPGLSWKGETNKLKITGTLTTTGTYQVKYYASNSLDLERQDEKTITWTVRGTGAPRPNIIIRQKIDGVVIERSSTQFGTSMISLLHGEKDSGQYRVREQMTLNVHLAVEHEPPLPLNQEYQVTLFLEPENRSKFSLPNGDLATTLTFNLKKGENKDVTLVPLAPSQKIFDVLIRSKVQMPTEEVIYAGSENTTNAGVQIPETINSKTTPEKMTSGTNPKYRIPPGDFNPYRGIALVTPNVYLLQPVFLTVESPEGSNPKYGTVRRPINKVHSSIGSGSNRAGFNFTIEGVLQTLPSKKPNGEEDFKGGNSGQLRLQTWVRNYIGALDTKGFSVAAVPIAVNKHGTKTLYRLEKKNPGTLNGVNDAGVKVAEFYYWGTVYGVTLISDSNAPSELNKILWSEVIEPIIGDKGNVQTIPTIGSVTEPDRIGWAYLEESIFPGGDPQDAILKRGVIHQIKKLILRPEIRSEKNQWYAFGDMRTGIPIIGEQPQLAIPIDHSGFKIYMFGYTTTDKPKAGGMVPPRFFLDVQGEPTTGIMPAPSRELVTVEFVE